MRIVYSANFCQTLDGTATVKGLGLNVFKMILQLTSMAVADVYGHSWFMAIAGLWLQVISMAIADIHGCN